MSILRGSSLAKSIHNRISNQISKQSKRPGLGIILVGDKPDSKIYVNAKKKACKHVGINCNLRHLPKNAHKNHIINEIHQLNMCPNTHGILVQLPLPNHLDERDILNNIKIEKDVDCFNSTNMGNLTLNSPNHLIPCTPKGILKLLDYYQIDVRGKDIVVVGASKIVGMPLSIQLIHKGATVTTCHINTKDYRFYSKNADIVIVATGNPNMIKKNDLKKGAVVIDVGINKISDKIIVGDVDFQDVKNHVSAITPVPGGVGPMTIAMVLQNTFNLFCAQENKNSAF